MIVRAKGIRVVSILLLLFYNFVFAQSDEKAEGENDKVFEYVDVLPEFPGGQKGMVKFIQKNFHYPQVAIEENIEGKCYVKFVVDKKGIVRNAVIERGVHDCPECDAEALRVINKMPKWKPGKVGNKKVNCYFRLPINFKLE